MISYAFDGLLIWTDLEGLLAWTWACFDDGQAFSSHRPSLYIVLELTR